MQHSSITLFCKDKKELIHGLENFIYNINNIFERSHSEERFFQFVCYFVLKIQKDNLTPDEKREIKAFLHKNKIINVIFVTKGEIEKEISVVQSKFENYVLKEDLNINNNTKTTLNSKKLTKIKRVGD